MNDQGGSYFDGLVLAKDIGLRVSHLVWSGKIKNDNTGLYENYSLEKVAYNEFSVLRVEFWK